MQISNRPWVLSLDVGTSSVKAVGYDDTGRRLPQVTASAQHRPSTTADGGSELAAQDLLERCLRVLRTALDSRPQLAPPTAVAFSCFWHSLVGLNAAGEAVTPAYLWADTRSHAQASSLRQILDEQSIHARTGCHFHTSYLPARLLWLRHSHRHLWDSVRHWVSFPDYAYLQLFGELISSYSMASGSGLFDQNRLTWDAEVCEATGVKIRLLPKLVDTSHACRILRETYGSYLPELADIPWFVAAGDGACSNLGAGCTEASRLALMVGTSGAMRCIVGRPHLEPPPGLWCYRLDSKRFVLGGALSNGGNAFAWLQESLRLPPVKDLEALLATMDADSHGLTILPFLTGERSPGWASDATGTVLGLRLHTTPEQIVRAFLEAIALRFVSVYERLHRAVPDVDIIVATGGALLRSPAWMQIMADALATPLQASLEAEASCRGAAILALESLGVLQNVSHAPTELGRCYEPRQHITARYTAARARQEHAYRLVVDRQY